MSTNAEYGVFSESAGGCIFAPCYSPEEAEQERARMVAEDGEDAADLTVMEMCLDHPHAEQPKHGCEECAAEGCGAMDPDDMDACGDCMHCTGQVLGGAARQDDGEA